jgi:BirA family biotin operon repressor/biotin-[acetyl-CoA-carboxylase] ligase
VDLNTLQNQLADLPLGQVAYFRVVGSTNSEAMRWINEGASHLSLVVADEQTAGRGRSDRTWQTVPGAALAFSLVIRPPENGMISASRLTGLGALAVCDVLRSDYGLPAKIKWPNDVLCGGKKLAGVLVEAQWQADDIQSAVLGIGINVARESVPSQGELDFPATSVEDILGSSVDRWKLLKEVLAAILTRLPQLDQDGFIEAWEDNLAYRQELVQVLRDDAEPEIGRILGLDRAGYLRLVLSSGEEKLVWSGDIKLRRVDRT